MQFNFFGKTKVVPEPSFVGYFYPDVFANIMAKLAPTVRLAEDDYSWFSFDTGTMASAVIESMPELGLELSDFGIKDGVGETISYNNPNMPAYSSYQDFLNKEVGNLTQVFWPYGSWYCPLWGASALLIEKYAGVDVETSKDCLKDFIDRMLAKHLVEVTRAGIEAMEDRILMRAKHCNAHSALTGVECIAITNYLHPEMSLLPVKSTVPSYLLPLLERIEKERIMLFNIHNLNKVLWQTLMAQQYEDDKSNIEQTIFSSHGFTRSEYKRISRCASRSTKDIFNATLSDAGTTMGELFKGIQIPYFESGHGSYEIG